LLSLTSLPPRSTLFPYTTLFRSAVSTGNYKRIRVLGPLFRQHNRLFAFSHTLLLRAARVDLKSVRQGDQQIPFVGRRPSGGEKPGRREQLEAPAGRRQKKRIARKTQRSFPPLGRQKLGRQTQLVPRGYFPRFR